MAMPSRHTEEVPASRCAPFCCRTVRFAQIAVSGSGGGSTRVLPRAQQRCRRPSAVARNCARNVPHRSLICSIGQMEEAGKCNQRFRAAFPHTMQSILRVSAPPYDAVLTANVTRALSGPCGTRAPRVACREHSTDRETGRDKGAHASRSTGDGDTRAYPRNSSIQSVTTRSRTSDGKACHTTVPWLSARCACQPGDIDDGAHGERRRPRRGVIGHPHRQMRQAAVGERNHVDPLALRVSVRSTSSV